LNLAIILRICFVGIRFYDKQQPHLQCQAVKTKSCHHIIYGYWIIVQLDVPDVPDILEILDVPKPLRPEHIHASQPHEAHTLLYTIIILLIKNKRSFIQSLGLC